MTTWKDVKRSEFASFLNVGTKETKEFKLMNIGITTQTLNYNAQTEKVNYIGEDNARESVNAYQMELPTTQIAVAGDPVFNYIDGIRRKRGIGSDCKGELLLVYKYAKVGTKYPAELSDATVVINSFGGDGGGKVSLEYTVSVDGDPKYGYVEINEGVATFTEGVIPEA